MACSLLQSVKEPFDSSAFVRPNVRVHDLGDETYVHLLDLAEWLTCCYREPAPRFIKETTTGYAEKCRFWAAQPWY